MDDAQELDLLQLIKKNYALLIILTVSLGVGAYFLSYLMPDMYTASTSMYVLRQDENGGAVHVDQNELTVAASVATDVVNIMKSERVAEDVAAKLGIADLGSYSTSITNESNSRLITLKVTGKDPLVAATIAGAIVSDTQVVAVEAMNLKAINVIDNARVPTKPSGPNHAMIGAMGAAVGLLLAFVISVLRTVLDTRIHNDEEIVALTGLSVVGHFPINS